MSEITNTMGTIIAETACGHEGDINKLKLLISELLNCGFEMMCILSLERDVGIPLLISNLLVT